METQLSRVAQVCRQLCVGDGRSLADKAGWLPSERHLAEHLEVSRTVVREATKRLELQGVLEVQHGVGIRFVDRLHEPFNTAIELSLPNQTERLRQLAETRVILEPSVARLAAERAKREHLRALRITQQRLSKAIETTQAIENDLEFHRILAQAAGNRILELILESLGELGRASRQATLTTTGVARAVEHHALILAAIVKRDGQAAFDAMSMHVQGSARDLAKYFSI
jgi:GntR family transcriptional repressor for pyruvate dehydrogenase complex